MSKGKKTKSTPGRANSVPAPPARKERAAPAALPKWLDVLLKPHNAFGILALVFGSAFIVTTPPFQVPDEAAHFFRVFSLSEFDVAQDLEGSQAGDRIPASFDSTAAIFDYLRFVPDNKVPKGRIREAMDIKMNVADRKFVPISAGNYFYPSYLPQLPAMWIGRLLDLNVLSILYFGRFTALFFYIFCVWYALRSIPMGKYLLLAVALLPMCLAQAGSYSPDCVSFAFAFLSLALILKYAMAKFPPTFNLECAGLIFMMIVMGVLKPVFLPIALLAFLMPQGAFPDRRRYLGITMGIVAGATLLAFGWLKMLWSFGSLQAALDINGRPIDPAGKMNLMLKDPMMMVDIFSQTVDYFGKMYFQSTIGIIGYLDTYLPGWIYTLFTLLVIALAFFEGERKPRLLLWQRGILIGVSIVVFVGTILTMYLYTRIKDNLIAEGAQGRYFIPVLFSFLAAFHAMIPTGFALKRHPFAAAGVYLVLFLLLLVTQLTLYSRFYG